MSPELYADASPLVESMSRRYAAWFGVAPGDTEEFTERLHGATLELILKYGSAPAALQLVV